MSNKQVNKKDAQPASDIPLWQAMFFPAIAAGMGWGIRGQYGHETGAMIAGVLASLTIVLLFIPKFQSLLGARSAALMTAGIAVGGSMTYGQTVGLTHDRELVGNWMALSWGMVGLAIKGGLWIGFSATFLGVGLGGLQYRFWEMILLQAAMFGMFFVGVQLLNSPFDPPNKILPWIYFSDSWAFEPDAQLKPRPEVWGGVLAAWVTLVGYCGIVRRDSMAWRLALWGLLAGGLGFPLGQSVQAFHAWNAEAMAANSWSWIYKNFNWWNMMETTFGCVWGAVLGCGVWVNRHRIKEPSTTTISLTPSWEIALCGLHVILLVVAEFSNVKTAPILVVYSQYGLVMIVLPIACCVSGRFWPYLMLLPIAAVPIILKSLREFCFKEPIKLSLTEGWILIASLPAMLTLYVSTEFIARSYRNSTVRAFASVSLVAAAWIYLGLNTVFFDFAWPWQTWTGRTPNQLLYMTATLALTYLAVSRWRQARMQ